jgi:hypothetical protein
MLKNPEIMPLTGKVQRALTKLVIFGLIEIAKSKTDPAK